MIQIDVFEVCLVLSTPTLSFKFLPCFNLSLPTNTVEMLVGS